MKQSLQALLQALEGLSGRVPQEELAALLSTLCVDGDELAAYLHFSEYRYQRTFIHTGPWHHLFVLCWRNGQSSPVHDHTGSSCAMRVLRGTATERLFSLQDDGRLQAGASRQLPTGIISVSSDGYLHQVANLQPDGADLVTLHLYSPPLLQSRNYELPASFERPAAATAS